MLWRALRAETLKLRRTLALALTLIAPLVVTELCFFVFWKMLSDGHAPGPPGAPRWGALVQQNLILWSLLMLPLFIALETALLAGLEHSEKNWKLLYTTPVPRWTIYAAKQILGMALIGLSVLIFWALVLLDGLLLRLLVPGKGFEAEAPWQQMLGTCAAMYLASWVLLSLHTWVAVRWPSFVVALSVGIAGTVVGVLVLQTEANKFYPWTAPAMVVMSSPQREMRLDVIAANAAVGLLLAVVAAWEISRREVV
jgi:lantibiotic transport system permease protein